MERKINQLNKKVQKNENEIKNLKTKKLKKIDIKLKEKQGL